MEILLSGCNRYTNSHLAICGFYHICVLRQDFTFSYKLKYLQSHITFHSPFPMFITSHGDVFLKKGILVELIKKYSIIMKHKIS